MPAHADGSMRRDILSAYVASASRIGSWVIVSALVYRRSPEAFAMLALVRGTLGILNYCSLGLLPAMIQAFASIPTPAGSSEGEGRSEGGDPLMDVLAASTIALPSFTAPPPSMALAYVTPATTRNDSVRRRQGILPDPTTQSLFSAGVMIALIAASIAVAAALLCGAFADRVYRVPTSRVPLDVAIGVLTAALGFGYALRWSGDPASALLQARHRIALDNEITILTEAAWAALTWLMISDRFSPLVATGIAFAVSGLISPFARMIAANLTEHVTTRLSFNPR